MPYTNKILVDSGYQDIIRDKLGLGAIDLPDSKVDRMDGVELGEKLIIKRLTNVSLSYSTILTGDDALYLKMATIFCICALLAKDFGQGILRAERLPDYQYENFQIDMKAREKVFWDKAEEQLAQISGYIYPTKSLLESLEGYTESIDASSGTSSPY